MSCRGCHKTRLSGCCAGGRRPGSLTPSHAGITCYPESIFFYLCRRKPEVVKKWIIRQASAELGADYDVKTHFTPNYNPWRQRLCFAPDADFFSTIKAGKACVVTDRIATFTESGIRLQSGRELAADIIVTATGLNILLLGGIQIVSDGSPVKFSETTNFKGVMFSDVPNLFVAFGYTNASRTLKCDLTCAYVARLINHMDRRGYVACTCAILR
jgi:monooxygenase